MMDKEVQLMIVAILGIVSVITVFNERSDLASICVSGLLGYLGGKSDVLNGGTVKPQVTKKEVKDEMV